MTGAGFHAARASAAAAATANGNRRFFRRINLDSDPKHSDLPAVPATDEGVPATRLSLVSRGVLENLQYPRFWARERKREPTPGPVNYVMESTDPPVPVEAMIKTMKRGLLISRFWDVRLVDPRTIALTGLTRDGLWWIENGEVRHPVRNLRFNQSVLAMLAPWNVEAIGPSQRLSPFMVPPLRLSAFTFTSAVRGRAVEPVEPRLAGVLPAGRGARGRMVSRTARNPCGSCRSASNGLEATAAERQLRPSAR